MTRPLDSAEDNRVDTEDTLVLTIPSRESAQVSELHGVGGSRSGGKLAGVKGMGVICGSSRLRIPAGKPRYSYMNSLTRQSCQRLKPSYTKSYIHMA